MGSAVGGAVPGQPPVKPSKPFLLYAQLTINDTCLQILIDTGASATCICAGILHRLSGVQHLDTLTRCFVLADGAVPLTITGSVQLSMLVDSQNIPFQAFVAEKLCVDLILGMDFMLAFQAVIDISSQQFSLEFAGRRCMVSLDDHLRRPLVALSSRSATTIAPRSTVAISVYAAVSSVMAYSLDCKEGQAKKMFVCVCVCLCVCRFVEVNRTSKMTFA